MISRLHFHALWMWFLLHACVSSQHVDMNATEVPHYSEVPDGNTSITSSHGSLQDSFPTDAFHEDDYAQELADSEAGNHNGRNFQQKHLNSSTSVRQNFTYATGITTAMTEISESEFQMVTCPSVSKMWVDETNLTGNSTTIKWILPGDARTVVSRMCVKADALDDVDSQLCSEEFCFESAVSEGVAVQLCSGHVYNLSVTLQCNTTRGETVYYVHEPLSVVPGPPQIKVHDYSNVTVVLKWDSPASAYKNVLYTVAWNDTSGAIEENTTDTTYIVKNLHPYTYYKFAVRMWSGSSEGNWSRPAIIRTDVGVPDPPSDVTLTAVDSFSFLLKWEEPHRKCGSIHGYDVLYAESESELNSTAETFDGSARRAVLHNMKPHTRYHFQISSFSINKKKEKLHSRPISVENMTLEYFPGAPQNLRSYNIRNTSMSLQWDEPKEPNGLIVDYAVTFNISEDLVISKVTTEKNVLVTDLQPFIVYFFSVSASTRAGQGNASHILVRTDVGVPSEPLDMKIKEVSAQEIKVTWSPPNVTRGSIDGYFVVWYESSGGEESKHIDFATNASYDVTDLKPWTNYTLHVGAYNLDRIGEPLFGQPVILDVQTSAAVPKPPTDVIAIVQSSRSVYVGWSYSGDFPGPMNYSVQVWKKAVPCLQEPAHLVFNYTDGLSSWTTNSTVVTNLEPFTFYAFRVQAQTESGSSFSAFSHSVQTKADVPGPPHDLRADCSRNSTSAFLFWRTPTVRNGIIVEYSISYSTSSHDKPEKKIIPVPPVLPCLQLNYTTVVSGLKPEMKYNFSVKAKTYDVGYGPETVLHENCILPSGVPPFPDNTSQWKVEATTDQEVTVTWSRKLFSAEMGRIMFYAVIVAVPEKIGRPRRGELSLAGHMPVWGEFWCGNSDMYQATPKGWNPLAGGYDPMNCKISSDSESEILHCTVGWEKNCTEEGHVLYCNGPLKPGKQYGLKLRAFTRRGFAETYPILVSTKSKESHFSLGLCVGLTFLFIAVISGIAAFVIARKKVLPIPNILVFFQKPVDNHEPAVVVTSNANGALPIIRHPRPLSCSAFLEHVKVMMSDSALKFSVEYEELKKNSPRHPCTAAEMDENRQKNRWMNIFPFDHSRVKLLPIDDEPGSDYINASYIPGFSSHREYIASQGPLAHTIDDFWRMIWEQKVFVIVMLAQCVERGKKKCEQYWPAEEGKAIFYGDLQVELRSESVFTVYTMRVFDVLLGSRKRTIKQMHFTRWPDFGCPESTDELINFVRAVRDSHCHNSSVPILVHCSAGVGRTGTFIAVDRLLQHIELYDHLDIYSTVMEMREYRVNMVQTEDQYIYIHKCMRDVIMEKMNFTESSQSDGELYEIYSNLKNTVFKESGDSPDSEERNSDEIQLQGRD